MEKKGGEILERLEMGRRTSQRGGGGLVRVEMGRRTS